ncbi:MAG: hypothetical protein EPN94_11400 [Nitrospirae bacterium]|nr:MAG: hypothetical protein EPN94_11400 [Nitrospirota bacterium]
MQVIEYEIKDFEMPLIEMAKKEDFSRLCPFVQNPDDDCYIVTLDSLKVEAAIYYCGENFKECDIYKKLAKAKRKEK